MFRKHNLDSLPKFQCTVCGFLCDNADDAERHKKEHEESHKKQGFQASADNIIERPSIQEKNGKNLLLPIIQLLSFWFSFLSLIYLHNCSRGGYY